MNTGTLDYLSSSSSWTTSQAEQKSADFLSLKLLNKRGRLRISPSPLDLHALVGRVNFFTISKLKGWFAAIARTEQGTYAVVLSTLEDLRSSITSSTVEGEQEFKARRTIPLTYPATPLHITFALADERLVIGFGDSTVAVYDSANLLSDLNGAVEPLVTLPNTGSQGPLQQVLSNPGDLPELVLLCRETVNPTSPSVEILDVRQLKVIGAWSRGQSDGSVPICVAWSPKGKQFAIGLRGGQIVTFSPSDVNTVKQQIDCPPQAEKHSIVSLNWLTNNSFYGIYIPEGSTDPEVSQVHCIIVHDAKLNSSLSVKFESPYFGSLALRPPGAYSVIVRNWDPAKFLIFVGDSTSSDIGLVGCLSGGAEGQFWANLSLEETSTPSVPLDNEFNDTIPLALELDHTYASAGGNGNPVMYLYASDGTLQSWHVMNELTPMYPGMTTVTGLSPMIAAPMDQERTSSEAPSILSSASSAATPPVGQPSSPAFGSTDTAGVSSQPNAQSAPSFGSGKPAFGTSSFSMNTNTGGTAQEPSKSAFGQGSASAQPFGFGPKPGGFGSFASSTSPFGSPSSGFGGYSQANIGTSSPFAPTPPAGSPTPTDAASPEADMAEAGSTTSFGGLSLGTSSTTSSEEKTNSIFGNLTQPANQTNNEPAPTPSSAFAQPARGFGAFGSSGTSAFGTSAFSKPSSAFGGFANIGSNASGSTVPQPSSAPAFGISSFSTPKPVTASGQPAFGQSAFGAPSFGKSSFGSAANTSASPSTGFGAFAQSGTSGFGSALKVQPTPSISMSTSSEEEKATPSASQIATTDGSKSTSGSTQGGFAAFGPTGTSPFGKPENEQRAFTNATSTFGAPNTPISTSAVVNESASTASPVETTTGAFGTPSSSTLGNTNTTTTASIDPRVSTFSARTETPGSSPEGSPAAESKQVDKADLLTQESPTGESKNSNSLNAPQASPTPFGTPSPSPFKSSQPASGGGAFGNLTSRPSPFKPAEGFGAFGSSSSAPSPFANPKPTSLSAFGTGSASGQGETGTSSTPVFGSPSGFGSSPSFGNSALGSTIATPSTTPNKGTSTSSGAFSAFSGNSGFGSFARAGKQTSFSDLSKSQTDEKSKEPTNPPVLTAFAKIPNESKADESGSATVEEKARDRDDKKAAATTKGLEPESSFIKIPSAADVVEDDLPPTPSSHGTFDEEEGENVPDDEERGENEVDEGNEEQDAHGDMDDFISESESESEDSAEHDDVEEVEQQRPETPPTTTPSKPPPGQQSRELGKSPTKPLSVFGFGKSSASPFGKPSDASSNLPAETIPSVNAPNVTVPSSPSASLSATDKTEKHPTPSISPTPFGKAESGKLHSPSFGFGLGLSNSDGTPGRISPSPGAPDSGDTAEQPERPGSKSPSPFGFNKPAAPSSSEGSTTPHGSPENKQEPSSSTIASPIPVVASTSSGMTSLGLGRPSSRPVKSSPLATAPTSSPVPSVPTSTSAPVAFKARPASPRTPFGQLPTPSVKAEPPSPSISLTPVSQLPISKTPPLFPSAPASSGKPLSTTTFNLTPSSSPTPFKFPPASATPSSSFPVVPGNAPFIMPFTAPTATPKAGLPTAIHQKGGPLPTSNLFGSKPDPVQPIMRFQPQPQPQPQGQLQLQTQFESMMQEDCQTLCLLMAKEFENLKKLSAEANAFRERNLKPALPKHTKEDLGDSAKWSFGDLDIFEKTVKSLESDILRLIEFKDSMVPMMREVESNLLKAETRKEEIVRFSKAKADPEFAKMLKARTLGPEHSETQNQLRKHIRLINDRVEQLEMHLKSCKKKLEEERKGKSSIKPPSLDTINRTYHNIDIAIEDQTERITALTARVAMLDLDATNSAALLSSARHSNRGRYGLTEDLDHSQSSSLSASDGRRSWSGHALYRPEVTPNVAASTAAALNAERSAQRLKVALARSRTAPLMNMQAVEPALPTPTLESMRRSLAGSGGSVNSAKANPQPSAAEPPSEFPDLDESLAPAPSAESRSNRVPRQNALHQRSVPLNKTHQRVPSAITTFDWGPLPGTKPMSELPSNLFGAKKV